MAEKTNKASKALERSKRSKLLGRRSSLPAKAGKKSGAAHGAGKRSAWRERSRAHSAKLTYSQGRPPMRNTKKGPVMIDPAHVEFPQGVLQTAYWQYRAVPSTEVAKAISAGGRPLRTVENLDRVLPAPAPVRRPVMAVLGTTVTVAPERDPEDDFVVSAKPSASSAELIFAILGIK